MPVIELSCPRSQLKQPAFCSFVTVSLALRYSVLERLLGLDVESEGGAFP